MVRFCVIFLAAFSLLHCMVQSVTSDEECGSSPSAIRTAKLNINSKRNQGSEWVDTFSARTEVSNSSDNISLDATHRVTECDGKRVIYIQGVIKDSSVGDFKRGILFHPKCGKNVAIINNGRTAQKMNLEDPINSVAFTNRPLKNNEIFEVRLDKKNTKFSVCLGIGVMIRSPEEVDILAEMHRAPIAWMMHHTHIYSNNSVLIKNYGRSLDELQVGDRVGVMRSDYGTLHFFVNGVDQGPAASNIPHNSYGILELWHNAAKATIVDP